MCALIIEFLFHAHPDHAGVRMSWIYDHACYIFRRILMLVWKHCSIFDLINLRNLSKQKINLTMYSTYTFVRTLKYVGIFSLFEGSKIIFAIFIFTYNRLLHPLPHIMKNIQIESDVLKTWSNKIHYNETTILLNHILYFHFSPLWRNEV